MYAFENRFLFKTLAEFAGLIPLKGFFRSVVKLWLAAGPSPFCVTAARLTLYLVLGFKFSKRCFVVDADMLKHTVQMGQNTRGDLLN